MPFEILRRAAWAGLRLATLLLAALPLRTAWAQAGPDEEGPLTQADIDAYIYFIPRLSEDLNGYPAQIDKILREAKVTRRRALYLAAKIPLTQALARGLVSPSRLLDESMPLHLRPTTEEVKLVNANLHTLMQAESAAIDFSGVKVPRKFREAPH